MKIEKWPGKWHMITPGDLNKHFASRRRAANAYGLSLRRNIAYEADGSAAFVVCDVRRGENIGYGPRILYTLEWFTHKGWQAANFLTGALVP